MHLQFTTVGLKLVLLPLSAHPRTRRSLTLCTHSSPFGQISVTHFLPTCLINTTGHDYYDYYYYYWCFKQRYLYLPIFHPFWHSSLCFTVLHCSVGSLSFQTEDTLLRCFSQCICVGKGFSSLLLTWKFLHFPLEMQNKKQ